MFNNFLKEQVKTGSIKDINGKTELNIYTYMNRSGELNLFQGIALIILCVLIFLTEKGII